MNSLKNEVQENRCRYTGPSGRRCKLPRAAIHDSLCVHHARLEGELSEHAYRTPEAAAVIAQVLGSRDRLNTTTAVNDALAKLFSLRAKKLISARDTVILAYVIQLLLQTLSGSRNEFSRLHDSRAWDQILEKAIQDAIGAEAGVSETPAPETRAPARQRGAKNQSSKPKRGFPRTAREFATQVLSTLSPEEVLKARLNYEARHPGATRRIDRPRQEAEQEVEIVFAIPPPLDHNAAPGSDPNRSAARAPAAQARENAGADTHDDSCPHVADEPDPPVQGNQQKHETTEEKAKRLGIRFSRS